MTTAGADTLTVINGPEDGTAFAIAHRSFAIGADGDCAVAIRLDRLVREVHARAEVVSEGYRFRSAAGARVFVNGRPVGTFRSRVARHGDIVRAGGTELVLSCAPEGLAGRSRGLRRQSDWMWAVRAGSQHIVGGFRPSIRIFRGAVSLALRRWMWCVVLGAVILYACSPQFRAALGLLREGARSIGVY
jgi:hypothetical protein